MPIEDSSSADEAFTLERHGDLTIITATEALETHRLRPGGAGCGYDSEAVAAAGEPADRLRPESGRQFRLDVPGALDPLLEAGSFAGRDDGPLRGDRPHAGIAARDRARHGLADLRFQAGSHGRLAAGLSCRSSDQSRQDCYGGCASRKVDRGFCR